MPIYFGGETKKAIHNWPFNVRGMHADFIRALLVIKEAGAEGNYAAGAIAAPVRTAIVSACRQLRTKLPLDQFPLPFIQGGAGTSIHMNVNEVVASLATEILKKSNHKIAVHPNDHVNRGMSTNDVIPTALRLAAYPRLTELAAELAKTVAVLGKKAKQFRRVSKLARTHLQDAIPTTLGAEFASYQAVIERHIAPLRAAQRLLLDANLGGTAIGNGLNAGPVYQRVTYKEIKRLTGVPLKPAVNLMAPTGSATDFLMVAQAAVAVSADLSKIANDLRLLSSGPLGGFGEINLPEMQKGSSIMPGKVNPVIAELVSQIYFLVSGNCRTIEMAAQAGQLELNVMLPVAVDRLLEIFDALIPLVKIFNEFCLSGITANEERCREILEHSFAYATCLTPALGYDVVSAAVKQSLASGRTLRDTLITSGVVTRAKLDTLLKSNAQ